MNGEKQSGQKNKGKNNGFGSRSLVFSVRWRFPQTGIDRDCQPRIWRWLAVPGTHRHACTVNKQRFCRVGLFSFFAVSLKALRAGCPVSWGIGLIKCGGLFAGLPPLLPYFSALYPRLPAVSTLITAIFN